MMVVGARRKLIVNGVLMSACFAGLEGCVIATINLSAAIVPPEVASRSNGILYLFFALGTFVAPTIVLRAGSKQCMVASMLVYTLYLASYIQADPTLLLISAVLGGGAGAVLWVAQGSYFTRNALAYDALRSPRTGSPAVRDEGSSFLESGSASITAFAGIFAFAFQLVTTLAKPTAALLLTLHPDDPSILFGALTGAAVVCSLLMLFVAPFPAYEESSAAHQRPDGAVVAVAAGRSAARASTQSDASNLLRLLFLDRRALLLAPYNSAFGLTTAFFPSHVTVLTKAAFHGRAAAVGWLYTTAGVSSALAAALAALAAQRFERARPCSMLLGSAGFGVSCTLAAFGGDDHGVGLSRGAIGAMYVCYGLGVAAWQGSCMAMVGDLFREDPRAAFAHLKLTSGLVTFAGFFVLPRLSLRAAALATLVVNLLGAATLGVLLRLAPVRAPVTVRQGSA